MKSLAQLWRYIRPYRSRIWMNIFFNLLSAVFAIFSLLMVIPFLKLLFSNTERVTSLPENFSFSDLSNFRENGEIWLNYQLSELIGRSSEINALLVVCAAVMIIFFLKNLFRYLALYAVATVKKGVIRELHTHIYERILEFRMSYFHRNRKGDLISRFTSDVQEVEYSIIFFLESFIKDPITIVITLVTMFLIDLRLTLIVLITLPISGLVIGVIGKRLKQESREVQDWLGRLVSRFEETLSGIRVIKAFTASQYLKDKFEEENERHFSWSVRMLRKRDLSAPMSEFLGILVVVIILWLGGRMVFSGQIQPEVFITYIAIFSQIISPSKAFSNAYYYVRKGMASLDRIEEITSSEEEEDTGSISAPEFSKEIIYENVSFGYTDIPVISNLNLHIAKGERIAVTGQSGSGKSTLVDLLLGLYRPDEGRILIDGNDLCELDLLQWRKQIGLVPQETVLFNDTLRQNILLGMPSATEEQVERAARLARVTDFLQGLENGLDTYIGDNGSKLSGGQKQRLALARAFLRNSPLLILDEATSALDTENENIIAQTLLELPRDITVIIIAHRSSTVKLCDRVLEIDSGRFREIARPAGMDSRV